MKYFTEAIKQGCLNNLKTNNKYMILGLGMAYPSEGLAADFPNRVIDTPVSELSITGMAVGLAARGFKPLVVHGRINLQCLLLIKYSLKLQGGIICLEVITIASFT